MEAFIPKVDTFQDLVLDKDKDGRDLWRWIYGEVRAAILDGRLKPGMRLPSSRSLSTQYGVARGTVVVAFEQLHAEGYVKVGKGLMFISLDVGVLDALRAELEGRGLDVKDGQWGYRLMVIADPDGNQLYFPYPRSRATDSVITSNPGH